MENIVWIWSKVMVVINEIHALQGLGNNDTFLILILSPHIACQQYEYGVALQVLPVVSLQNQLLSKVYLECLDYDAQHRGTWQVGNPMVLVNFYDGNRIIWHTHRHMYGRGTSSR